MPDTQPTPTAESEYKNIDELPLGKLLKVSQGTSLKKKKKKSLVDKLRLQGLSKGK